MFQKAILYPRPVGAHFPSKLVDGQLYSNLLCTEHFAVVHDQIRDGLVNLEGI